MLKQCRLVFNALNHHRQGMGGFIVGKKAAGSINDEASSRRDRLQAHPISLRLGKKLLVVDYL